MGIPNVSDSLVLSFPEGRKLKAEGGGAALENRGRKLFLERARESVFQALQAR